MNCQSAKSVLIQLRKIVVNLTLKESGNSFSLPVNQLLLHNTGHKVSAAWNCVTFPAIAPLKDSLAMITNWAAVLHNDGVEWWVINYSVKFSHNLPQIRSENVNLFITDWQLQQTSEWMVILDKFYRKIDIGAPLAALLSFLIFSLPRSPFLVALIINYTCHNWRRETHNNSPPVKLLAHNLKRPSIDPAPASQVEPV